MNYNLLATSSLRSEPFDLPIDTSNMGHTLREEGEFLKPNLPCMAGVSRLSFSPGILFLECFILLFWNVQLVSLDQLLTHVPKQLKELSRLI